MAFHIWRDFMSVKEKELDIAIAQRERAMADKIRAEIKLVESQTEKIKAEAEMIQKCGAPLENVFKELFDDMKKSI